MSLSRLSSLSLYPSVSFVSLFSELFPPWFTNSHDLVDSSINLANPSSNPQSDSFGQGNLWVLFSN
ncbi:hypothetical protein Syun_001262 [Stephania yunnanensis]|uniref:Uncharacterized protein n=1 Tax=Stephania yunnanensis TaxID=152371 RepID=A0AAP0LDE5_9MAGN